MSLIIFDSGYVYPDSQLIVRTADEMKTKCKNVDIAKVVIVPNPSDSQWITELYEAFTLIDQPQWLWLDFGEDRGYEGVVERMGVVGVISLEAVEQLIGSNMSFAGA